ncbi:MAG TPA: cysteine desulfurase family protein [Xanthobacteraceae bacterium]|nr:cysteine desulfurase family protein [Xanthobacteraceae bacterium]
MTDRRYLDWNATAPLRPEARAAMTAALDVIGNPSSVHAEGREARHLVESAREAVAALVGAESRNVIFTAGGTEANALALTPQIVDGADRRTCDLLLMSTIEHASVRSGGRFRPDQIEDIPVDGGGRVDLSVLAERLAGLKARNAGFLVSVMHANNETGVIQPIAEVAELVHAAGGLLHVDAVQSAGKISCRIGDLGADLMSVSAHKIGGPKGVGALVKAREALQIAPLVSGGGQERGARAGTENVIGIAGFGAAAAAAQDLPATRLASLRDRLEQGLLALHPQTRIFGAVAMDGSPQPRLPNTTLFAVPGVKAETALIALDLEGVAVSSGSACSSGKVAASQVLKAMEVPADLAAGALRVSIGPTTTPEDLDFFLKAWEKRLSGLSSKEKRGLAA